LWQGTAQPAMLLPSEVWWWMKKEDQATGWGQCFEFPSVL